MHSQATAGVAPLPPATVAPPALAVSDVHKSFHVPHERQTSLKERLNGGLRGPRVDKVHALGGVSFDVPRGEFLGIVGRNGSGKSTLLKIAAGIYEADRGEVRVAGRLSPVIELGVGFTPELSARDNVLMAGALLDIPAREVRERLDAIFSFADVEDFVDVKLKNYSSGMAVRLAFSTALHAQADVLLVDEVLAVGDAAFQAKCFEQFERLRREGRTVVLVSHDMDAIERYCDRAVLLENGLVAEEGDPARVADRYREENARRSLERAGVDRASAALAAVPRHESSAPLGPPAAYRPSALGDDLRHFIRLSVAFARSDIQVHYKDSALGYLWSVIRPLALFAVIYAVFSQATGLGQGVQHYPVYLFSAIVLWTFFTETTGMGLVSLQTAQALMRKMRFPRLAIPVSVLLKSLFNLGTNYVAVLLMMAIVGVRPRLTWLELPLLILALALLASGLVMILSVLYVRYRDVGQAWQVAQQLLFFSSPIIYVHSRYPESVRDEVALTPLSAIFTQMRHAVIDPSAPSAAAAAGGGRLLLVPIAITLGTFALGMWVFRREAPRIAERV